MMVHYLRSVIKIILSLSAHMQSPELYIPITHTCMPSLNIYMIYARMQSPESITEYTHETHIAIRTYAQCVCPQYTYTQYILLEFIHNMCPYSANVCDQAIIT
jgi:hypothetical protein